VLRTPAAHGVIACGSGDDQGGEKTAAAFRPRGIRFSSPRRRPWSPASRCGLWLYELANYEEITRVPDGTPWKRRYSIVTLRAAVEYCRMGGAQRLPINRISRR